MDSDATHRAGLQPAGMGGESMTWIIAIVGYGLLLWGCQRFFALISRPTPKPEGRNGTTDTRGTAHSDRYDYSGSLLRLNKGQARGFAKREGDGGQNQ